MRGPDCNTDHKLIRSTFKFTVKPAYSKKTTCMKRLDTAKLLEESCRNELKLAMDQALSETRTEDDSPEEAWTTLSRRVFETAANVLGYSKRKNTDWFDENNEDIKRILQERNHAVQAKLMNPSTANVARVKIARAEAQRKLRDMENPWWVQKAKKMQERADENNSLGFFNVLKEVHVPQTKMSDVLLAADGMGEITEPTKVIER